MKVNGTRRPDDLRVIQGIEIHHLITDLGPGGAEFLVFQLAQAQVEQGHFVHIWTMSPPQDDYASMHKGRLNTLRSQGVRVERIGRHGRDIVTATRALRTRIGPKSDRLGVVHAHNAVTAVIGRAAARGRPVTLTYHSPVAVHSPVIWRAIRPMVRRWAAVSQDSADALLAQVNVPVRVVPNGIPLARQDSRPRLQRDPKQLNLIAVGNPSRWRKYDRLLHAVAELRPALGEMGMELRLRVVGGDTTVSGAFLPGLRQLAESLGINDAVDFLGFCDNVTDLLSEADIFVKVSDHEGHPISLLEAMAAGLPCVVTPFSSAKEILDSGCGLIARDFTASAISESLLRLARAPQLRQDLAQAGSERVRDFGIQACAEAYEELYFDSLPERSERRVSGLVRTHTRV